MHSGGGRFVGGLALGFGLGLIGTGIAWGLAASSDPVPASVPTDVSDPNCYRQGYIAKAKSKNVSNAVLGSLVGTAAIVTIIVVASSGS